MKFEFKNRELSWLEFNERVLQEACDRTVPIIERIRFIGIFSNNLDEFFKVRYATIKRIAVSPQKNKKLYKGLTAKDLLNEITKRTIEIQNNSSRVLKSIKSELKNENIFFINEKNIPTIHKEKIFSFFSEKILPQMEVIIFDKSNSFPIFKDSNSFLIVKIQTKVESVMYALIKIPEQINRFFVIDESEKKYVIFIDDIIRHHLKDIFKIFGPKKIFAFNIKMTRDAELDFAYDISKSYLEKISQSLKKRQKGKPVRLVYDSSIHDDTLNFLMKRMGINKSTDSIIPAERYHNRRDFMQFPDFGKQSLIYAKTHPLNINFFDKNESIFQTIKNKDVLQHTPFHKFIYTLRFLSEASIDPDVKSISITIYRLSKLSMIANTLINASKNGKLVTVQIELQARFDEKANIKYAKLFEENGVKLVFGLPNLKVHAKICVVEKKNGRKYDKYGFISTGNFNESTAKVYTDITLFTANKEILDDVSSIFDFIEINYKKIKFNKLFISPFKTKSTFKKLIRNEIRNAEKGQNAWIKIKLNSITNYEMIEELYKASIAGVKIEMIVRGICCLIPGNSEFSKNIEVKSIVDKYLEHTRFFIFCSGGENKTYISSADWMTRNLDNRIEVTCPLLDPSNKKEILEIFNIYWLDNLKSRKLNSLEINEYSKNNKEPLKSQDSIYNYYQKSLEK